MSETAKEEINADDLQKMIAAEIQELLAQERENILQRVHAKLKAKKV